MTLFQYSAKTSKTLIVTLLSMLLIIPPRGWYSLSVDIELYTHRLERLLEIPTPPSRPGVRLAKPPPRELRRRFVRVYCMFYVSLNQRNHARYRHALPPLRLCGKLCYLVKMNGPPSTRVSTTTSCPPLRCLGFRRASLFLPCVSRHLGVCPQPLCLWRRFPLGGTMVVLVLSCLTSRSCSPLAGFADMALHH